MEMVRNSPAPVGGGWLGVDLAGDASRWTVELPQAIRDELLDLAAKRAGLTPALEDTAPKVSRATAEFVSRLRDMLTSDPHFGVVSGCPCEPFPTARDAYWLLGLLLGDPVPQNPWGTLIGHIEELESTEHKTRGGEAAVKLPLHSDTGDLVGLLCIRPAPSGGSTRLMSARAVHDLLLAEAPHHLAELYRPLPYPLPQDVAYKGDRSGRWPAMPVFGFAASGELSAWYSRRHVEAAQRQAGSPQPTVGQVLAMDALEETALRAGVPLDLDLRAGDLLLFNNAQIVHSRTSFVSAASGEGRLLLRLWLSFAGSQELPDEYLEVYGATAAGSYRGGSWPSEGRPDRIGLPVRSA
jgi:hypothetical protein